MRLPPRARLNLFCGRRRVHGVVHPAMPGRSDGRGLRQSLVDHPASLESERRIDSAFLSAVVAIAVLVFTDKLAMTCTPHQRVECRTIPPRKESEQKFLRRHVSNETMNQSRPLAVAHGKKPRFLR